jgi:hypothetical protein
MAGQVAERKRARREAAKPKVEDWITKADWQRRRKADKLKPASAKQTRLWKDGSKFIRLNKPNGTLIRFVCVSWRH